MVRVDEGIALCRDENGTLDMLDPCLEIWGRTPETANSVIPGHSQSRVNTAPALPQWEPSLQVHDAGISLRGSLRRSEGSGFLSD